MITVIIPAYNEEATIASVVKFARGNPLVSEIIVVDDNSSDQTVAQAMNAGARVISSANPGKGTSMKEGVDAAINDILVFLDADIDPYPMNTISDLTLPLIQDHCDFAKANFSRNSGRITELVAKPLLSILFPALFEFNQPLSGMIAGRKHFFRQVEFLPDYGVDIGILIDMHMLGARIKEVNIGYIQNKSKPWRALAKMSHEVTAAILGKSIHHKPKIQIEEAALQTAAG